MNEQLQRLADRYERATGKKLFDRPMTNADRIRAMSDDEFSEFLIGVYTQDYWDHPNDIEEWLQQPVEEG